MAAAASALPRGSAELERPEIVSASMLVTADAATACAVIRGLIALLPFAMVAPIVVFMGDKSPKAKQRDQQQKNALKATNAAQAKVKQEGYSRTIPSAGKK